MKRKREALMELERMAMAYAWIFLSRKKMPLKTPAEADIKRPEIHLLPLEDFPIDFDNRIGAGEEPAPLAA
jgi:hypothetical protein